MATILDGRQLAATMRRDAARQVKTLCQRGIAPTLAVVLLGEDPASQVYVRNKTRACTEVGIANVEIRLPATVTQKTVLQELVALNNNAAVHAILVQLPLPRQIDAAMVLQTIDPRKDVDGFHPENVGRLHLGLPGLRPCTPLGIMALIQATGVPIAGAHAVVLGRSAIVGRPTAALLTAADATVTLCHSRTQNLPAVVQSADIVVAAIGRPHSVHGDWIRPGAVVIDVGMNRVADPTRKSGFRLTGDVHFPTVSPICSKITPVPGGVGPMTVAMLMANTVKAHRQNTAAAG